jgi:Tat protein translocase TatB subunit
MLNIGGAELLIILLVALIFLGPQRLPDVARQLGQTVSSLRSLASGFQAEIEAASKPVREPSMMLDGPTDQAEAIAATQDDAVASQLAEPATPVGTDPFAIKKAALDMDVNEAETPPVSAGGPRDLNVPDLTGPDVTAQDLNDGDEHE